MTHNIRAITQRWIIKGTLELQTPTHLSNGDDDPVVDLPVLVDPLEGRALLTGASLAGALRNYVREYLNGFATAEQADCPVTVLFGGKREDDEGAQSSLVVEDALGPKPHIEFRDGVSIDPETRTAEERKKYDRQLLAAGTTFDIGFELIISHDDDLAKLLPALRLALCGLQRGEIRLGGRKQRGYGQCKVTEWRIWAFDLRKKQNLARWLAFGRDDLARSKASQRPDWNGTDITTWDRLQGLDTLFDQRSFFTVEATFVIDGSLLVRSGFEQDFAPDMAHIESQRKNGDESNYVPVLPGTSLAGVIRAQALRIACTTTKNIDWAVVFVNRLFGYMPDETRDEHSARYQIPEASQERKIKRASRVRVDESEIEGAVKLVQSRVKIDRFTGGAYESALFAEQPLFGGEFCLKLQVRNPTPQKEDKQLTQNERERQQQRQKEQFHQEIGLLLLVIKDLWTGFVPVGGEASVGRGRLRGHKMTLMYQEIQPGRKQMDPVQVINNEWVLNASGDGSLKIDGNTQVLNDWVKAFNRAAERG